MPHETRSSSRPPDANHLANSDIQVIENKPSPTTTRLSKPKLPSSMIVDQRLDPLHRAEPQYMQTSERMGAAGSRSLKRSAASAFEASNIVDLTIEDEQPPAFGTRKRRKSNRSSDIDLTLTSEHPDMDALFEGLRHAAATSYELLDPLSMLEDWHRHGPTPTKAYGDAALRALEAMVPNVRRTYMKETLQSQRYLLLAFLTIKDQLLDGSAPPRRTPKHLLKHSVAPLKVVGNLKHSLRRLGQSESIRLTEEIWCLASTYWDLQTSLNRRDSHGQLVDLTDDDGKVERESQVDCACCGESFDIGQSITCTGTTLHFFCRDCTKQYVEVSLIGSGRAKAECFAVDSETCTGEIDNPQLALCVDESTVQRLERIQQQTSLRQAFPDTDSNDLTHPHLEQCPKCEYQAWIDHDFNSDDLFNCQNPACQQVTCRKCHETQHPTLTCAEAKAGSGIEHAVAEALSDRLVRTCAKCNNRFVKETDHNYCNKMFCSVCNTVSCFICGATGVDYNHFNDSARGGKSSNCPLWHLPPVDVDAVERKVVERMGSKAGEWDRGRLKAAVREQIRRLG